jgi:hypothetical protein
MLFPPRSEVVIGPEAGPHWQMVFPAGAKTDTNRDQIVFIHCLDLYYKPSDSGERQDE